MTEWCCNFSISSRVGVLTKLSVLLVFSMLLSVSAAEAKVKLAEVFTDHMVVQGEQPIRVWGSAGPGEVVGVKIADQKVVTQASGSGDWSVTLPPLSYGGPYELVVAADEKIVVKDILVGEVWLAGGQSNMAISLHDSGLLKEALVSDPEIRFLVPPATVKETPSKQVGAQWKALDASWAQDAGAIPYYFALEMRKKLKRPIGIIQNAMPGSPIQAWISLEKLATLKQAESLVRNLDAQFKHFHKSAVELASHTTTDEHEGQLQEPIQFLSYPATSLFNGMVSPLAPFVVKGVLWYQGEANVYEPTKYPRYFSSLIQDWRKAWNRPDLPFIFVQLAPYGEKPRAPSSNSYVASLRDAQAKSLFIPWTYMTSAIDSVNMEDADWHASDKRLVAERLAKVALATQYNIPSAIKGPSFESVTKEGDKLRIKFKYATKGLTLRQEQPTGFAIAGDDRKMLWAHAKVEGDSVLVWNELVAHPHVVSYLWADNPRATLFNGENLPALPFKVPVKTN